MAKKKIVTRRRVETVRERADKQQAKHDRVPRHRKVMSATARPAKNTFYNFLSREFHLIKTPDSKVGRVLGKRQSLVPSFATNSVKELKKVTWPTWKQALSMTLAVIIFSFVIAAFVRAIDYGLDKLFKEVILK